MSSSADSASRPSLLTRLLPAAVAVGLVVVALWALGGGGLALLQLGGAAGPRVGAVAPDFTLSGVDGGPVTLSELRGKKVVINFWATWCPPCRAEMPDLDRVAREYADRGVVVLAVDQLESSERVTGYLGEIGLGSPALVPVFDLDGSVGQAYRVNALPSTFVVDGEGVIRDVHLGPLAEGTLRAKLERVR
jgi:thiol-disulfide isomerase/thioredoxin